MFDGRGLYIEVSPNGGKWWRLKYRFGGKEKLLSMGTYPDTSLKKARERREEERAMVASGIDPSLARRAEKTFARVATAGSFEAVELPPISENAPTRQGILWRSTLRVSPRRPP